MASWAEMEEEGKGTDREENRYTSCKYINYNELSRLELSGSVGSAGQCTAWRLAVPVGSERNS